MSRIPSARSVAQIERVLAILDSYADQHHALNELAELAGLSRFYFSRTFRAVVGRSLRDYLRDLKLRRAIELLRISGRSLTDIAVEAGFYDLPHLDKVFRQRLGTSPYRFRAHQTVKLPRRGSQPIARRP
jgi:transcriptional regulator GlxA family with amidase domain